MSKCYVCGEEKDPMDKLGPVSKGMVYVILGLLAIAAILAIMAVIVLLLNFLSTGWIE